MLDNCAYGVIIDVHRSGVGLIEAGPSRQKHPFTFDSVCGYGGEEPADAGLTRGRRVKFSLAGGVVNFVEVI